MTHPTPQGQLSPEQIEALAACHLGEMHVENCGLGDIVDLARAIERAATESLRAEVEAALRFIDLDVQLLEDLGANRLIESPKVVACLQRHAANVRAALSQQSGSEVKNG